MISTFVERGTPPSSIARSVIAPTVRPVAVGYDSSGFGARIDPFTGRRTQHDGVDFVAQGRIVGMKRKELVSAEAALPEQEVA